MLQKRQTKIVATLGPASEDAQTLTRMIQDGMNVARLNLSHANHAEHAARIRLVRQIAKRLGKPVAILLDLGGPKIRIGVLKAGKPVQLVKGKTIRITSRSVEGTAQLLSTNYAPLIQDVKKGDPILLDDGKMSLAVIGKKKSEIICRIGVGGWLKSNKGINLPGTKLSIPALTPKDLADLKFGLKQKVDFIALSFVRSARDVLKLKELLHKARANIPVIAKIEKAEAIENLEAILQAADGVMVARGDLGVEVSLEKVPVLQKQIIQSATKQGVLVITATQMLESMIESPVPTRAETTDIANAVFDGTDALMLSGETASGKYPVQAIQTMSRIAAYAEKYYAHVPKHFEHDCSQSVHAVVHAACRAAHELNAKAILVFTQTGKTAGLLSKLKPDKPIFALTPLESTYQRMSLFWNVIPLVSPLGSNTDEMIQLGEKNLLRKNYLKKKDVVVIVAGTTLLTGATNMMKILQL